MKSTLQLLLLTLLALAPLRLIAMGEAEDSTPRVDGARQENTESNSLAAQTKAAQGQHHYHNEGEIDSYKRLEEGVDLTSSLMSVTSVGFYDANGSPTLESILFQENEDDPSSLSNSMFSSFYDAKMTSEIKLDAFLEAAKTSCYSGSRFAFDAENKCLILLLLSDPDPSYKEVWEKFFNAFNDYCYQNNLDSSVVRERFFKDNKINFNKLDSLPFTSEKILWFAGQIGLDFSQNLSRPECRLTITSFFSTSDIDGLGSWNRSAEIHYYSDSYHEKKPVNHGILSTICPVLYRDKNEREQNRKTIDQIAREIGERPLYEGSSSYEDPNSPGILKDQFERSFKIRRFFGEPITVGAYLDWEQRPDAYLNSIFYCCERVATYAWAALKHLFYCCIPKVYFRELEEQENSDT